jgi:hypothetical protein
LFKKYLPLILVLALLLAACASSPATAPSAVPSTSPVASTPTSAPTNAPSPSPTGEQTLASPGTPGMATTPANCTVVSRASQPDPTVESLFPPVSSSDWVQGPDTAKVTFIEYSDFQ